MNNLLLLGKLHKNPSFMNHFTFVLVISFVFFGCKKEEAEPIVVESNTENYSTVKSIIDNNCVGCHSYGGIAAGSGIFSDYSSIANSLMNSEQEFINRINSTDPDYRMPPAQNLSSDEIAKLSAWINNDYPQ